ncbi:nucleolar protein 12 [Drosophila busckii]|uniref:nucleolar protein 12 n=1 Tax=Drosophila busckii TaxID=30019 RepID=UPI00083EBFC3|nr:nucleolar protein 12 [Drosophila busckii]
MKVAKNKSEDDIKSKDKLTTVAAESKAVKKKPKAKKPKAAKPAVAVAAKASAENLTVADLAKIQKKKAKKEAQKLKKQERKLTKAEPETTEKPATKNVDKEAKSNTKQTVKPKAKKTSGGRKDEETVKRERDPAAEAATVFVGNLPINTKRVQLKRLFQPYGKIQTIRLRTAGGKNLFKHKQRKVAGSLNAYVVLETPEIAEKALALNGTEFKDNHLRVTPSAKAPAMENGSDADAKRTVFVGNLKYSANEEKLREIFSSCGEIDYIRCLHEGEKGCKGVAYVCFQKPDAVGLALELNETLLDDRPIHVERYSVKKLGAKETRDAATKVAPKSKKNMNSAGAKKRLDKKQLKENGKPGGGAQSPANKKKSEYRGVKVDGIKKNKKPKQKSNKQMNVLAKKIAPKSKN